MIESIELHSNPHKNGKDDDIQEYHEIIEDTQFHNDNSCSSKFFEKTISEYDFFTKLYIKTPNNNSKKTKKTKKKAKPENLMDVVNSEIAAVKPPVTENIITMVDYSTNQRMALLKYNNGVPGLFKKRPLWETELGHTSQVINLSPIFPMVLENTMRDNKEIPVEYVEPTMYNYLIENYDNKRSNSLTTFVDITLKNLKFNHHHKFSLEKLLTVKLTDLYYEYEHVSKTLKDLFRDIKINRETKNNLKEDLININPDNENTIRFDPIIRKYTGKLLQLKERCMEVVKHRKEVMHKIGSLWSDIEMVRVRTKSTVTTCILNKNEKDFDEADNNKQWVDLFNVEFADALDKIEYDYVSKYTEYKEAKQEQKLENSIGKKISKPKLIIDEAVLNEEIEKTVNEIIENNKVDLILKEDENIIYELVKSDTNSFQNIYYFEIYIDDIFVCESEKYADEGKFNIEFIETFSIQILPNNNIISLILKENNATQSHVKIDLTEIKKKDRYSDFIKEKFSYDITVKPTSKHIGSGSTIKEIAIANKVRLKSCGMFQNMLYTTGEVCMQIRWNVKSSENYAEAIKSSVKTGREIKRLLHGIHKPNIDTLKDLITNIFAKDITNDEIILNALRDLSKTCVKVDYSFAIDVNSPEFVRYKLLHLRNNGGFTNVEDKMVPLRASQISTEQLNCLQKTHDEEFDLDYFTDNDIDMDPIELQRFVGAKYIERLNKNMLKNLNDILFRKTYKDVVRDFNDLSLRGLLTRPNNFIFGSLSNITKQQILKEFMNQQQEIQITVLRACNLLDRSATVLDSEDDDRIAGFKMHPLRPFVRVSYRGISVQTVTAIGCHPTWNHTIKINAKLSPLSSLHVNVYDEYKENITEGCSDEEHSNKTVQYRYYNKWLGTLEIPLYNVLALGTLHGTFKITTPPMIFGYENSQIKTSTSLVPEINQMLKKDTSFIVLRITTNLSHLGRLQQYNQPTNASDNDLIKHLNNYTTQYANDFPFRSISLTFIDSAGANKCITEFLQQLPVPNSIFFPKNPKPSESALSKSSGFSRSSSSNLSDRKEIAIERGGQMEDRESVYSASRSGDGILKMINACIRYVALMPSYEATESHAITLTGLELLKILHGSPLDHAILLASYFMYLDIKCWVVTGLGLPRGHSSYVLAKYDLGTRRMIQVHDQYRRGFLGRNDGCLWYVFDSVSGERFELRDVGCPLKTVEFVFDNENIWVNVQTSQDCDSVSFDFSRSSDWRPVFDRPMYIPKPVPKETSLYSNPRDIEALRQTLEMKIKGKVQKWRSHAKTIWNRYCGTLLRESLPRWEYWAFNPMEQKPGPGQRLKQLMITHKMFGFPLNIPFTSTRAAVSRVKSTGLHQNVDPNVEFALGVDLFSYPNNVISVWVYLASITRI